MPLGRYGLGTVGAVILAASHAVFGAQPMPVETVLTQVARFVGDFLPEFANVVAVESYEQRTTAPFGAPLAVPDGMRRDGFGSGSRSIVWRLSSDFMLVRYQLAGFNWVVFRDPIVVNGIELDRRKDRLVELFTDQNMEAMERAAVITMESVRFQIPGGSYAVTNPLLVVALMQAHYQPRLRFTLGNEERVAGTRVRRLRFEEREEPPGEPGNEDRAGQKWPPLLGDVGRVRGTVWIEPETGRILRTEARLGAASTTATSLTMFAQDEGLGLTVPVEMRTSWTYMERPVNGIATYGEFRRFGMHTDTQVELPAQP